MIVENNSNDTVCDYYSKLDVCSNYCLFLTVMLSSNTARSSSRDETANVNFLRWHRARTTKYKTVQRSGSLQKFYRDKIRLAVEFENNEWVHVC